jgi:hypothetical protein
VNSHTPTSENAVPRWRIVVLVLVVGALAVGIALALMYGGKMTALLDTL